MDEWINNLNFLGVEDFFDDLYSRNLIHTLPNPDGSFTITTLGQPDA